MTNRKLIFSFMSYSMAIIKLPFKNEIYLLKEGYTFPFILIPKGKFRIIIVV